jgi:flagellar secretion chaperone FliS
MWNNGHNAYLESRILSASPLELVHLLYQGCVEAVREARYHLAGGRIAERSQAINRACEILMELTSALDQERGGEIAQHLAQLYDYMQGRLLQANIEQSDMLLAEVLALLATLGEAWEQIQAPAAPGPRPEPVWSSNTVEGTYTAQSWSL